MTVMVSPGASTPPVRVKNRLMMMPGCAWVFAMRTPKLLPLNVSKSMGSEPVNWLSVPTRKPLTWTTMP